MELIRGQAIYAAEICIKSLRDDTMRRMTFLAEIETLQYNVFNQINQVVFKIISKQPCTVIASVTATLSHLPLEKTQQK